MRFLPSPRRLLAIYVILYVAILYFPVLLLPVFSFNDSATPKLPLVGLTFRWYESLAGNAAMQGAAWNSLIVGVSAAVLSTVLGICAARAITRHRFRGKGPASALIMAPLILPEIIIA
ncbi:MAG: ABC transporter permease, partial [Hoeflea sp.]|nr:ABC transporter permease [Hoeflea sp.]